MVLGIWAGGCTTQAEDKKQAAKVAERPPVAVEVTKVVASEVTGAIDVTGSLAYKFGADVKSEYTGIVTDVFVTEWVRVKKGDPLAKLDTREAEVVLQKARAAVEVAKANILQAEVSQNRADREFERAKKLKETGLITQQNFDDARTETEAAKARVEAAKAQLRVAEEDVLHAQTRLSKSMIRSPLDGMVSYRNVNVGDFVGEMGAKPMFRIVDTRILELTVTAPSGEMGAIRIGQPLRFSTDAFPGKNFIGKVMFINPVVNEADRSIKVVAEVENHEDQLKGGLFVQGRILTGKRSGVLKIPRAALLSWDVAGKKGEVFVVHQDVAKRKPVQTGTTLGDQVEITSGLAAGDRVISRGGFNVKEGDKVNVTRVNGEK
ncbi:MAG: efflux RND transporter periplasmic adaptor subunit [Syntrophaceae bacterium]|nr:efflux RND transporter periplasmic adaptor subunit [Syntrophaceae bacterium]